MDQRKKERVVEVLFNSVMDPDTGKRRDDFDIAPLTVLDVFDAMEVIYELALDRTVRADRVRLTAGVLSGLASNDRTYDPRTAGKHAVSVADRALRHMREHPLPLDDLVVSFVEKLKSDEVGESKEAEYELARLFRPTE